MKLTEDLAERLTVSESTQASMTVGLGLMSGSDSSSGRNPGSLRDKPSSFPIGLWNTASTLQDINSNLLQVSSKELSRLPTGLNNMAKTYQDLLRSMAGRARRQHLTRTQGLILTVTFKDYLVHWLGTCPQKTMPD
jgi:hypothetical protein